MTLIKYFSDLFCILMDLNQNKQNGHASNAVKSSNKTFITHFTLLIYIIYNKIFLYGLHMSIQSMVKRSTIKSNDHLTSIYKSFLICNICIAWVINWKKFENKTHTFVNIFYQNTLRHLKNTLHKYMVKAKKCAYFINLCTKIA